MSTNKDWVNSLGLMFMAYATLTDGEYSPEEKGEVINQHKKICDFINLSKEEDSRIEIDYNSRIGEIIKWYMKLKFEKKLKEAFFNILDDLEKMDFWSKEVSIKLCVALYKVANIDDNVVLGEAEMLTDLMERWDVSVREVENAL